MKRLIVIISLILIGAFVSCEESDSGCGEAYFILENKVAFSVGVTINRVYRTLSPDEEYKVTVQPGSSVTYTGTAGVHRWGNTYTLDDCETKKVSLTID